MAAVLDHVRAPAAVRFTRQDCERMRQLGLLPAQYELVNGEVIAQMGQNTPHATTVTLTMSWLLQEYGPLCVLTQASIDVAPEDNPTSEPAPDITVLHRSSVEIATRPVPRDIRLLIEVADTTLSYDLEEKAPLYARAGVGHYWVFDVNGARVYQHSEPRDGAYQEIRILESEDSIAAPGGQRPAMVGAFFPHPRD